MPAIKLRKIKLVNCLNGGSNFLVFSIILGGNNNGMNPSQLVRQELRAVVSGRTQQNTNVAGSSSSSANSGIRTPQSPLGLGQGPMVGGTNGNNQQNSNLMMAQQQQPGTPILNTPPDLDPAIRQFNFDMNQGMNLFTH